MKTFQDESGWLRVAVCCAVLMTQYGIRDSLLTALPSIATGNWADSETTTTETVSDPTTISTEASTNGAALYISTSSPSNGFFSGGYRQENPEFKTGHILNRTNERTSLFSREDKSKSMGGYQHENPEFKTGHIPNRTNERRSLFSKENISKASRGFRGFRSDAPLTELEFRSETGRGFLLPRSLFRAKLGGRNARSAQRGNPHEKLDGGRSISRRGKYIIPLFPGASDVGEREGVFRRLLDYIRTVNEGKTEDKAEDKRGFVTDGEFRVPLGVGGQNSFTGGWSILNQGLVLSSVYWGWLITALLSDLVISKLGAKIVLALSITTGGLFGLLTHAMSLGGPWVLLSFRIVFGAAQGFCYPAVTRLLQGIPESSRTTAGALVFLGPTLGSCLGAGLGSLSPWYVSTYLLGSLTVPLVPLCLMLPEKKDQNEKRIQATQVLKSLGARACILVYIANIFIFHTALVGLPFCLTYSVLDRPSTSGLVLLSLLLVVAVVVRVAAVLSAVFSGKGPLTVLNRRRLPIAVGSTLMLVALIVMATAGLKEFGTLVGLAVGFLGPGMGLTRIYCRMNLEDLAPWTLPRLLSLVNIAGIFIAIWPPILVASLAAVEGGDWTAIWLIPLSLIVPSCIYYMFLLTANSQPWDEPPDFKPSNMPNGVGPPRDNPAPRGHPVRMSFKSARSGLSFKSAVSFQTFKTAVSRRRSRTLSTRTIDEDLSVDMRSVVDEEEGAEVYSIEGSNQDCRSAVSTASFKSDGADMHSIDLNDPADESNQTQPEPEIFPNSEAFPKPEMSHSTPSDRTSEWLNHHHHVPIENAAPPPVPTKAEMRRRNAIYDLFW